MQWAASRHANTAQTHTYEKHQKQSSSANKMATTKTLNLEILSHTLSGNKMLTQVIHMSHL